MIAVRPKQQETMEVRFATTKPMASYFTDDDSAGSSEEVESPRSVGRRRRPSRKVAYVHSQIVRIREEDSHLGESSFAVKERIPSAVDDAVLFARSVLPSSPLKNTINAIN